MPRSELQGLLPPTVVSTRSRSDVLQQLSLASAGGGTEAATGAASASAADSLSTVLMGPMKDATNQLSALTAQITSLASIQQTQISATQENTQAVSQNTTTKGGSGSSMGSVVGGIASSVLGGGLGLSPIITGLMSLFGGGSSSQASSAFPAFQLPAPVDYQGGLTGSGQIVPVDSGRTRQVPSQSASTIPQVTIQVNAMDSRSFLDHSDEIASAVKAAILSSHSLNDVILEL